MIRSVKTIRLIDHDYYGISNCLYLKSSADKYVSPSEFTEIEFM